MRTLIIQSHSSDVHDTWMGQCLVGVERWAESSRFDYRFYGDEALLRTPDWYREKVGNRGPIVADLARLLLINEAIDQGYQQAGWIDADVLLFAPRLLQLDFEQSCAFGREYWVEADRRGRLKVRRNVHNAICVFRAGCPVLQFLIHATQRIIRQVNPAHVAPQLVGPKLLSALHNIVGFDLIDSVGGFSPLVIDSLEQGHGQALGALLRETPVPLAGANLCSSLNAERDLAGLCVRLCEAGGLPG
ncbi:MAG: hypothetical protein VB949_17735 [Pseudomonadales bacterium]